MVMTPTEHIQNRPMPTQHLSKATGLLKNREQSECNAQVTLLANVCSNSSLS
jgi:hypothetical protein